MFVEVYPDMKHYKGYRRYEIWLNYYIKIDITLSEGFYYTQYSTESFKFWCQKSAFEE